MNAPRTGVPVYRRLTYLLLLGQSLSSAAFIASATVGAIAGAQLSGRDELAGLPAAAYLLGAALASYPAARLMERVGRRLGLVTGLALGVVGALLNGIAINQGSFLLFLIGYTLMGATRGFTDLGRYAAAEMHPLAERARAISLVVLGGTAGAILGPALVGPTGQLAVRFEMQELAGPSFAAAALFGIGFVLIGLFLRPDPSTLARQFALEAEAAAEAATGHKAVAEPVRPFRQVWALPATRLAVAAMVIGQLVMVMIMSITSLHMTHHGHPLGDVSIVIMAHTLGMFGLSLISGRLADNFGRPRTIAIGAGLLIAACLLAPLSQDVAILAVALFLLGLGWNLCAVAGAALLTDTLNLGERARMQGSNDLVVNLVSAFGSLQSGALFAWIGYGNLSWISLAVSLIPLALALRFLTSRQPARAAREA
jgi:MFS family permease